MSTNSSIAKIYNERKDFIIIGLTGRTGSGCSTVADILKKTSFQELDLKEPKEYDYNDSEERKYNILYNYLGAKDNWHPFTVIVISSIITWFIIEDGYDKLIDYLEILNCDTGLEFDNKKLNEKLEAIRDNFESINDKIKLLDQMEVETPFDEKSYYNEMINTFNTIDSFSKELRSILHQIECEVTVGKDGDILHSNFYTYLYQIIGNNIRSSGKPFDKSLISDKFFTLAERTNTLIKAIRMQNKGSKPTLICLDALRNPFEASFFKDRYSVFYLMSINTDDESRRKRLSLHLRLEEIQNLDDREYPSKLKSHEKFFNQDIGTCLEISDIHIYNREVDDKRYFELSRQLIKYITLMIHPGLVTPTHLERCMQIAYNAKLNSGCLSRQVGASVTNEYYSIIGIGWNEVPKGQISCSLRDIQNYHKNKDKSTYSSYELNSTEFTGKMSQLLEKIDYKKLNGRKHPYCFKDVYNVIRKKDNQVYTRALHAEENAFLQVSKYGGVGVNGGHLFTTASPCELCAKKAFQLGIKNIYYIDPYPGISQSHILNFGDNEGPKLVLYYGAIGNAYISLYTPKLPFKDELELITEVTLKEK